jgi:hypothetical protein
LDENSVKKENKSLAEFHRQEEGKPVESHHQKEEEDDLNKICFHWSTIIHSNRLNNNPNLTDF